jgi:hypothetical protein
VFGVLVVNKGYHQNLKLQDIENKQAHPCVKYPKRIRIIMVRKTIHITEEQIAWLDDNAYNVSRLVRKVLSKIMNDEIAKEFFTKNRSKAN